MKKDVQQERQWAVERFYTGERAHSICVSLDHSRSWLYKWLNRAATDDPLWYQDQSRRPLKPGQCTPAEIEELVKLVRLSLYNNDLFCGAQAIQWELNDWGVSHVPSVRTINRILARQDLTNRRTGRYQPKGKAYPVLRAEHPNQIHQADFVGPCYLTGPIRFYSLNMVDLCTGRCGIEPLFSRSGQAVIDGFWSLWKRIGMPVQLQVDNEMSFYGSPTHPRGMGPLVRLCLHHNIHLWKRIGIPVQLQVDNEMSFYGSPTHPRGMGPLVRLCLHHNIHLWFIPVKEPWRNGVVEKFNDHYEKMFLRKVTISSGPALLQASHAFEYRHNSQYRYSKLGGKTPLATMEGMSKKKYTFPVSSRLQSIH